jgi:hypothetical protein
LKIKNIGDPYKSPKYGEKINGAHIGHFPNSKKMIEI